MAVASSFEITSNEWEETNVSLSRYSNIDKYLDRRHIRYEHFVEDEIPLRGPIIEAKVQSAQRNASYDSDRHTGYKPLWVYACMQKHHLNQGESTRRSQTLARVIRERGNHTGPEEMRDDCGHVVSNTLGGNMVDINLFPQNMHLNRGHRGNYIIWRAIEALMSEWLRIVHYSYNPMVEYQMLLMYMDEEQPDRPDQFMYAVRFILDDEDEDDDGEDDDRGSKRVWVITKRIINIAALALQDVDSKFPAAVAKIRGIVSDYQQRYGTRDFEPFLLKLEEILTIIRKYPKRREEPKRDRTTSWEDFVPVLGPLKTLKESWEDLCDGNYASSAIKLVTGGTSLYMDVQTLGGASAARAVGMTAAKEGGKALLKAGARRASVEGAKAVSKPLAAAAAGKSASAALRMGGKMLSEQYRVNK